MYLHLPIINVPVFTYVMYLCSPICAFIYLLYILTCDCLNVLVFMYALYIPILSFIDWCCDKTWHKRFYNGMYIHELILICTYTCMYLFMFLCVSLCTYVYLIHLYVPVFICVCFIRCSGLTWHQRFYHSDWIHGNIHPTWGYKCRTSSHRYS